MPYDFSGPVPGTLPSVFDQPAYPRWRRLLMRDAAAINDPNAIIVGGVNVVGGADNGITESAATSQGTIISVGAADRSRADNAASWVFDIRDQTNSNVDTTRPIMVEFLIEIVSMGATEQGLCAVCGLTNSLTLAAQHTETGMHNNAAGRRNRVGSQASVADGAANVGLVYSHVQNVFTNGQMSHSVAHALDANRAFIAGGKSGQNTILAQAGRLYAYFSLGRSNGFDGNSYAFGVRVYIREPIMRIRSFLP